MTIAAISSPPIITQETSYNAELIKKATNLGVIGVLIPALLKSSIADKIPAFSTNSTFYLVGAFKMLELGTILFTTSAVNNDLKYDQTGKDFKYRLGQGAAISLAALGSLANGLLFLADQGYISSENLPEGLTAFRVGLLTSAVALTATSVKFASDNMRMQKQANLNEQALEDFRSFITTLKGKSKEEVNDGCVSYFKTLSPSQQENLLVAIKKVGFVCTSLSTVMQESGAFL